MELNTSYQYKAFNKDSYNSLAAYATTIPATVTLHPGLLTIVISDNTAKEVGQFIDDNGLSFHINQIEVDVDNLGEVIESETTDASTLRVILRHLLERKREIAEQGGKTLAQVIKERDDALTDKEMYHRWYTDTLDSYSRVKSQVKAIVNLMNEVFK